MPWDVYKSHELNRLGSRMHNEHINDFYECAMHSIQKQTNKENSGKNDRVFVWTSMSLGPG